MSSRSVLPSTAQGIMWWAWHHDASMISKSCFWGRDLVGLVRWVGVGFRGVGIGGGRCIV